MWCHPECSEGYAFRPIWDWGGSAKQNEPSFAAAVTTCGDIYLRMNAKGAI